MPITAPAIAKYFEAASNRQEKTTTAKKCRNSHQTREAYRTAPSPLHRGHIDVSMITVAVTSNYQLVGFR